MAHSENGTTVEMEASTVDESERRTSSEIIAIAQRFKQAGNVQKVVNELAEEELEELEDKDEEALESANLLECMSRCLSCSKETENRMEELKKELSIDWHTKPIEQLQAEYGSEFEVVPDKDDKEKWEVPTKSIKGLSESNAAMIRKQYGENRLTPPKTKPEWVKFCEQLTGFF
eukprot:g3414.t1